MKIKNKRKPYSMPESSSLVMEGLESLLGASIIIESANIESVGQPVGAIYDFRETAEDGGHIYNQDWDAGTFTGPLE